MNRHQGHRSGATTRLHHNRPCSSGDDFLDASSKWLRSSCSSNHFPPLQDYNLYGVEGRMYSSNTQRSFNMDFSSSLGDYMNGGDGEQGLSPGLLDLHSIDTDLLSELPAATNGYDASLYQPNRDDSEPYVSNKRNARPPLPENNVSVNLSADNVKSSSVAKIKVVVRKRPLNKKELAKNEEDIIEAVSNSLTVHETKLKVDLTQYLEKHEFVFDAVLNEEVTNDEVYRETVEPIVPIIFQRTKATCFAYGQTGSGKTYTMKPLPLKASRDILKLMYHTYNNQGFQLYVSFFEIYGGKLFDLLNDRKKLCMREDGKQQVCIVGLQEYRVSDVETIKELIEQGSSTRSTGTTGANEESSRSHAILQLAVKRSVDGNGSKPPRLVGKLSFIDLAGSERGADTTDNDKQTRIEGAEINKSLLALKECIRALDNDQGHIPFRGSKLTEVLRDSFVGNSRTVMISCISPSSGSCEHTLNTLRYADRVKSLSKGNNSKKDILSSNINPRESTAIPLPSVTTYASVDRMANTWTEENDGDDFSPPEDYCEQVKPAWKRKTEPYGAIDDKLKKPNGQTQIKWMDLPKAGPKTVHSKKDILSSNINLRESTAIPLPSVTTYASVDRMTNTWTEENDGDDFSPPEDYCEHLKPAWKRKTEPYGAIDDKLKKPNGQTQIKWMDLPKAGPKTVHSDDDLNALLQEEEDLVNAHRKQVEETMNIVREEMNLLVEADQPGNQLDDYITKLNTILSQKAAAVMELQTRLANFQKRLKEHNVLVSSAG
ncbi:kinesin-like protein KIN-13B [Lotus japonicus]|uniref:kinesin-like protein KIN-13B n=1 Tax=Lotus japonicus TaxID=34305 RepID=UPI00258BC776|nr:kinesin-like protein KIN-13B [Lotus japonicus]